MPSVKSVPEKLNSDKMTSLIHRISGGFLSVVFMFAWVFSLVGLFTGKTNIIVVIIFFLLIGFARMHYEKGVKLQKLIQNYELYLNCLKGMDASTVEELAVRVNQDKDSVQANIFSMIEMGYVCRVEAVGHNKKAAYIGSARIVLKEDPFRGKQVVQVECQSCGAPNRIPKGESACCEYCGSKIQ